MFRFGIRRRDVILLSSAARPFLSLVVGDILLHMEHEPALCPSASVILAQPSKELTTSLAAFYVDWVAQVLALVAVSLASTWVKVI